MPKKQRHFGIFSLTALMFFLSLTLFGGSGISLAVSGVAPILVLSILSAFCTFNDVTSSAMVGFLCGAVLDSTSADTYCFNTAIFLALAIFANLLSHSVFNRNLKANIVLCLVLCLIYYLFYWLIFIAFTLSFGENLRYLLQYALASSLYTAVLCTPFYFIFKAFRNKIEKDKL